MTLPSKDLAILSADVYRDDFDQKDDQNRYGYFETDIQGNDIWREVPEVRLTEFFNSLPTGGAYSYPDLDFYARTYEHLPSGTYVIAFRGTDGIGDFIDANFALGLGWIAEQQYPAYHYVQFVKSTLGLTDSSQLEFTGHSLGGALATSIAIYEGGKATVFNPAPSLGSTISLVQGADDLIPPPPGLPQWPQIPAAEFAPGDPIDSESEATTYVNTSVDQIVNVTTGGEILTTALKSLTGYDDEEYIGLNVTGSGSIFFQFEGNRVNEPSNEILDIQTPLHSINLSIFLLELAENGLNFSAVTQALPELVSLMVGDNKVTTLSGGLDYFNEVLKRGGDNATGRKDAAEYLFEDLNAIKNTFTSTGNPTFDSDLATSLIQLGLEHAKLLVVSGSTDLSEQNIFFEQTNGLTIDFSSVQPGGMTGITSLDLYLQTEYGHSTGFFADFDTVTLPNDVGGVVTNSPMDQNDPKLGLFDGKDLQIGGVNNDTLNSGDDDDYLDGGAGNDELVGGAGADVLAAGLGDTSSNANVLYGGDDFADDGAADTFYGSDGAGLPLRPKRCPSSRPAAPAGRC